MAYVLEGLLLSPLPAQLAAERGLPTVGLSGDVTLLPVTERLLGSLPGEKAPASFPHEFWKLDRALEDLAQELSVAGRVAYIEVDFFGGTGTQDAAVWEAGALWMPPVHTEGRGAVNAALRALGVVPGGALDEFEAVGLMGSGRERSTESWAKL
jgi:hypothetical protein